MVLGPLAATILSIERCAASSLLFSIFSKPLTSGCVLQIGGGRSRAAAKVASEVVINPKTQSLMIRIPHSFNGFRSGIIRGRRAPLGTNLCYDTSFTPETVVKIGQNIRQVVDSNDIGEVAERLNAPVLKTGSPSRGS